MKIQYSSLFIKKLKKTDVRIKKNFIKRRNILKKNPQDPVLHNHELHIPYENMHSIDITSDYRAIFEEIHEKEEVIIYFIQIGTHKELYG